uniref:HTH psq-type domain-containing protein n=1 Tax=Trichuris muris TaxID=70415 RepID=A0A5S6QN69_TRIMR
MADRRSRADSSREGKQREVLSRYGKVKILNLLNRGMSYAEVVRRVGKNESSIRAIKQKEAQVRQSVCAAPTMAKRVPTNLGHPLWIEDMYQKHISLMDE